MAAAAITPKVFPMQGLVPRLIKIQKITQADWFNIPDVRGVILPSGPGITSSANATANAANGAIVDIQKFRADNASNPTGGTSSG